MQSLWSRAGQARRCGCRVCETAVGALGRRVTTAAARPRKVTVADVFTACYSSMFATAAVVDAIRKEDRRQELDRQLDETRRELAELKMLRTLESNRITPKLDADQGDLAPTQMEHLWESLKDIYTNRPYMKEISKPVELRVSDFLTRLQAEHYHCPADATMLALRRTDYERLEQAIMDEEVDKELAHRAPINRQQLHNDSRTIVHLVRQLLKRADAHDTSTSPSPSFDEAQQMVNKQDQQYTFDSIDPVRARKNRVSLNRRLRQVVDSSELGLKEKVGRVCYNLLVSAYPADMHTYNTLIVAFDKHGHKYISESLVNSFYYYRRLQPTPSTFVAILNHYKNSQNHGRFLRALACVTGLDSETGAKLGRRHVYDKVPTTRVGRGRATETTSTRTGDWTWEHAPLNKSLIEAVLGGLLHFKLFDQAATFFVSCMEAKVILSTNTIKQLFDECILALDWKAAVRLIRGFADCPTTWQPMLLDRAGASYLVSRLRVLIDLCGLPTSGALVSKSTLDNLIISSEGFHQFLNVLARADTTSQVRFENSSSSSLDSTAQDAIQSSKSRLLQIEGLWKEQVFVARTTRSIESKLLYPDVYPSPQFRQSMALHIGNAAIEQTLELNGELIDVLSQLPSSRCAQETLAECQRFQKADDMSSQISIARKIEETIPSIVEEKVKGKEELSFREERITAMVRPQPQAVSARPRRLITWPVPDQRSAYLEQGQWVGLG
ncbi:hypothetical protein FZEAL_4139 [Fusarium zealandicum]|uniref:Pentatricopeptide repeat domain-containing protein n=1 Tax=Fusarium zealandicum TaxID=1053134 RepID=A0A8H4UMY6_9HYPO|nr:hypothetical protein FZEAL_4139 [Fusarium zealandicum]